MWQLLTPRYFRRQGFYKGATSGPTIEGAKAFANSTEEDLRHRVFFARIYGVAQDFGLLPQQDYVYMAHLPQTDGTTTFEMNVWQSLSYGGTKVYADGDKYCNMVGHANGALDYVWTLSKGAMTLYPNAGHGDHIDSGESYWGPDFPAGPIWQPPTPMFMDRRDLHLADWNGDGVCDVIWVDPDQNNKIAYVAINDYLTTQDWSTAWNEITNPAEASSVICTEKRGLGIHDCKYSILGNWNILTQMESGCTIRRYYWQWSCRLFVYRERWSCYRIYSR